jgi:hypothetical protein
MAKRASTPARMRWPMKSSKAPMGTRIPASKQESTVEELKLRESIMGVPKGREKMEKRRS